MSTQSDSNATHQPTAPPSEEPAQVYFLPGPADAPAEETGVAPREPGGLRRGWGWVREILHQIHSGEDDMRAIYGDNPNGRSEAERLAGAAALGNLGSFGGGSF
jgi:hypothetical protein